MRSRVSPATIMNGNLQRPEEPPKLLALPQVTMAINKPDSVEVFEINKAAIIMVSSKRTSGLYAAPTPKADEILEQRHFVGRSLSTSVAGHFGSSVDDYMLRAFSA